MAEPRGNPRIAPTAHFTAQAWVQAGFEHAGYFDTFQGRVMFNAVKRLTPMAGALGPHVQHHLDYLWIRHAAYEERLRQLQPDVVVEIGAGLSPRGLSFTRRNPGLIYIEGDLPHMVAAKRRALAGVELPPNYHLGTVDLLGSRFLDTLPPVFRAGQKIAAITEGVTDYLSMDEKRKAMGNIASLFRAHGGGRYLFEVHARELYGAYRQMARFFTSALGLLVGARFDDRLFETIDEARRFAVSCGFDAAEVLELASLNTTGRHPPLQYCPYRLLEARIGP